MTVAHTASGCITLSLTCVSRRHLNRRTAAWFAWTTPPTDISASIDWGRTTHICVTNQGEHWFRFWLVAWSASSQYLYERCNTVNWTLRNRLLSMYIQNSNIFVHENAFEIVVCVIVATLSRPQCVNGGPRYVIQTLYGTTLSNTAERDAPFSVSSPDTANGISAIVSRYTGRNKKISLVHLIKWIYIYEKHLSADYKTVLCGKFICLVHPGIRDKRRVSEIDLSQPRHETAFWWRHNGPVTS